LRDQTPGVMGAIPFGLIIGAAGSGAGIEPVASIAMSILVFAGASQLVAIQLLTQNAPAVLVVFAVLLVNLRIVMYSAAVAPYFANLPLRWKFVIAYLLTDHSFALTMARFHETDGVQYKHWYFLGAGSVLWVGWQLAVVAGVYAGAKLPANWSLDFTIPLIFIALVIPALHTRTQRLAAVVAAIVSVFTSGMPLKTGLMVSAVLGVAAGMLSERTAK
jgi:4-azaleucine resistance transporter AzlC